VQTNGVAFEAIPAERTFNLVPGFECVPLVVTLKPGVKVAVRLEVGGATESIA